MLSSGDSSAIVCSVCDAYFAVPRHVWFWADRESTVCPECQVLLREYPGRYPARQQTSGPCEVP